jgi:hypothetical protein
VHPFVKKELYVDCLSISVSVGMLLRVLSKYAISFLTKTKFHLQFERGGFANRASFLSKWIYVLTAFLSLFQAEWRLERSVIPCHLPWQGPILILCMIEEAFPNRASFLSKWMHTECVDCFSVFVSGGMALSNSAISFLTKTKFHLLYDRGGIAIRHPFCQHEVMCWLFFCLCFCRNAAQSAQ